MKANLRARRMARNNRRVRSASTLSLVSLMDIFTIMLFFLLLNSGEVEVLDADKTIKLPESMAERRPDSTLLIKISDRDILVQGQRVASVDAALTADSDSIDGLRQALEQRGASADAEMPLDTERGRPVTIMGDQGIPYKLLKRVMTTCAETDYRDIALAVARIEGEEDEAAVVGEGV